MKRYAAVLLIALFALVKVNAQELIVIESNNLKCNDSVLVFTPVNVNENTQTLFLLLAQGEAAFGHALQAAVGFGGHTAEIVLQDIVLLMQYLLLMQLE